MRFVSRQGANTDLAYTVASICNQVLLQKSMKATNNSIMLAH